MDKKEAGWFDVMQFLNSVPEDLSEEEKQEWQKKFFNIFADGDSNAAVVTKVPKALTRKKSKQ